MRSVNELMSLKGRVAAITGGGGHIGGAIAEALAELGCAVCVIDQEAQRCDEVATRLGKASNVPTLGLAVDLADERALRDVPAKLAAWRSRLDVLVHCAALAPAHGKSEGWSGPFSTQSADVWRLALEVNLTAPFVLTQACAEMLSASGRGSVINIGSIYGLVGPNMSLYEGTSMGNPAAYAASKGGLRQLTRWLSTVLAPRVRVNSITPGGVWRNQPDVFHARYKDRTPLGRMGSEEDFKGAAAYLASDLSAYVTGHDLVVDGGFTVW